MFGREDGGAARALRRKVLGGLPNLPHFAPKAKRAVYMHMLGGPPQQDLFDYKPGLKDWYDKDLPDSVRQGQRLTTMSSGQTRFPIAPSIYTFSQHGQSGAWVSELLPHTAKMVDDIAIVKSLYTEQINHEPAITLHPDRIDDRRAGRASDRGSRMAWATCPRISRRSSS